jgi:FtsP/CotA-like multicopper oxidase with cupredoxin domain
MAVNLMLFTCPTSGVPESAWAESQLRVHTYYIAAEEVSWSYLPAGKSLTGTPSPFTNDDNPSHLMKVTPYLKAVYHEYTDATFQTRKPAGPEWEHLGILGPLIRAEVGDVVKVIFRNNTKILCSMHPHGLAYDKASEGALYGDGKSAEEKKGDAVPPGGTYTYTWTVPERAGPGPSDASSVLWMYHSHFIESRDMNSGLFGPIIVTAKGKSKPDGSPKDVDREFVVAFTVFDESSSAYFRQNVTTHARYLPTMTTTDPNLRKFYLMYSMNGLVDGNMHALTMKKGERVRWYLLANSNEDDVHTAHWHGQTATLMGMHTDTVHIGPMMMVVADMIPDSVGQWLFHCHVNDHMDGGMQTLFTVTP